MNPMSSLMTVVGPIGTIPAWVLGPSGTFSGLAPATLTNSSRSFATFRIRSSKAMMVSCSPGQRR